MINKESYSMKNDVKKTLIQTDRKLSVFGHVVIGTHFFVLKSPKFLYIILKHPV